MLDLNSFPKDFKHFLLIFLLLPFWIIATYIYIPQLYKTNDYLIIGSLSISLIIFSFFFLILLVAIFHKKNKLDDPIKEMVFICLCFQSITLPILIFSGYVFNIYFGSILEFYSFVVIHFLIFSSLVIFVKE